MMKWPKLASLLLVLSVPVVLSAVLVLYLTGLLPYRVYVIHTGSMSPTIPPKSAVVVQEHQYHVGQVVAFVEHGSIVTHRLVAINPNGTINTKGDANRTVDPWHVPTTSIIGGVVAVPHTIGYLIIYIKTPWGLASLLIGAFCIWQIWALFKELDETLPDATTA